MFNGYNTAMSVQAVASHPLKYFYKLHCTGLNARDGSKELVMMLFSLSAAQKSLAVCTLFTA